MRSLLKRLVTSPFFIAGVALVLRLLILYISWRKSSFADTGAFGFEAGQVAKSITSGKGFSSPLALVETGPTAFVSPLYPYLLAVIFKLWGIYTVRSHIAAQIINCVASALTIVPLYSIAKRSFGAGVAVVSSWIWVVLPSAWHTPIADVWETSLTVLWLTILVCATLFLRSRPSFLSCAGYGLLWAVGALLNAAVVGLLPFFLVWLIWDIRRQSKHWPHLVIAALLAFILGMAPWTLRNFEVFRKFIPLRSAFGLELWLGNNPDESDVRSFLLHPFINRDEANSYRAMGEIPYMHVKRQVAVDFMRSHPAITAGRIATRVFDFWFAVTDRAQNSWASDPAYLKAFFLFNAAYVLMGWLGLLAAWRNDGCFAVAPYSFILLLYPLVYYLSHTLARYRSPVEPFLVVLGVYGLAQAAASIRLIHLQPTPSLVDDDLDESETVEA